MKTALVLTLASVMVAVVVWRFIVPSVWKRNQGPSAPVPQLYGPLLLLVIAVTVWLLLRR